MRKNRSAQLTKQLMLFIAGIPLVVALVSTNLGGIFTSEVHAIEACSHENRTEYPANSPGCTTPGNYKYYYCIDCHKYFKEDMTTETNVEAETILPLGHDYSCVSFESDETYHWRTCSRCDNTDDSRETHTWSTTSYTWAPDNSTCTASHTCSVCNITVSQTVTSTSSETAATCKKPKTKTYVAIFTKPGFVDQTKEITEGEKLAHDWGAPTYSWSNDNTTCTATRLCTRNGCDGKETEVATASVITTATCVEAGTATYTAHFENAAFETRNEPVIADALGHDWVTYPARAATCTEAGHDEYKECNRCHEIEGEKNETPALGHKLTKHDAKAPTANASGNKLYWSCDRCGLFFSDEKGEHEIKKTDWFLPAKNAGANIPSGPMITEPTDKTDTTPKTDTPAKETGTTTKTETDSKGNVTITTTTVKETGSTITETETKIVKDASGNVVKEVTSETVIDKASGTKTYTATTVDHQTGTVTKEKTVTTAAGATESVSTTTTADGKITNISTTSANASGDAVVTNYGIMNGNNIKITNITVTGDGKLAIPSQVVDADGNVYKVTTIASGAFANLSDADKVILPDTIKKIESGAFDGFSAKKLKMKVKNAKKMKFAKGAFDGMKKGTKIVIKTNSVSEFNAIKDKIKAAGGINLKIKQGK